MRIVYRKSARISSSADERGKREGEKERKGRKEGERDWFQSSKSIRYWKEASKAGARVILGTATLKELEKEITEETRKSESAEWDCGCLRREWSSLVSVIKRFATLLPVRVGKVNAVLPFTVSLYVFRSYKGSFVSRPEVTNHKWWVWTLCTIYTYIWISYSKRVFRWLSNVYACLMYLAQI